MTELETLRVEIVTQAREHYGEEIARLMAIIADQQGTIDMLRDQVEWLTRPTK